MTKKNVQNMGSKETLDYGFYSNVLRKPFERLDDLRKAEAVYYEEQKAKEDKAAAKRAEAQKVEDAFKALNAARKEYKENVTQLTAEYAESLETLKKAYELGKKDIHDKLAQAEENFEKAHKEFTAAHPEGYHLTLKDGDFETTLSGTRTVDDKFTSKAANDVMEIFNMIFGM